MATIEEAWKKASLYLSDPERKTYRPWFERARTMRGAGRVFARIAQAPDREQVLDYLAEIRYALILAGDEFDVEFEPAGRKGPDLGIARDGQNAIMEVKRIRSMTPAPPELRLDASDTLDTSLLLAEYGNPEQDIRKAIEKLQGKFGQVGGSVDSIIAVWSDDEGVEESEVDAAVNSTHRDMVEGILKVPPGLQFILYGSILEQTQLHCYSLRYLKGAYASWKGELETTPGREFIQRALLPKDGEA